MNEPNEPGAATPGAETAGAQTYLLPEIRVTPDGQHTVEPSDDATPPTAAPPVAVPSPTEEPPIERRDPFAWMRDAPWMNRKLSPSGRAAILLRRDLDAFPVIEGRDPNHADLDAIVKRTVDYIVPIIKREQATDIAYDEAEKWRADRIAKARAAALTLPAAGEIARTLPSVVAAAARLAPVVAGTAGAAVAGLATLVVPTNFEGETFPLGGGLQARRRVGQRSIEIERQVDSGLLDSGVGVKWEKLPVAVQFVLGAEGRNLLQIDAVQLERAVGKEAADRLLQQGGTTADGLTGVAKDIHDAIVRRRPDGVPVGPGGIEPSPGFMPIMEMRITSSIDGGVTISHAEISDEDVAKSCPNYLNMQEIGLRAGATADAMGLPKGPGRGQQIHRLTEADLKTPEIEKQLRAGGMQELRVEQGFLKGIPIGFLKSGSSKIDVVERIGKDAVCVYDFKSGTAKFPDHVRERYLDEAAKYFRVRTVYVLPVYVP
jgi:hypothetical protein